MSQEMIIIKKYVNGKFYNTNSHRYMHLNDLLKLNKDFYQFIENKSKKDITEEVFLYLEYQKNLVNIKPKTP